ncbi:GntR family transcriptional regulator [Citreicella sp. C3M06]|uniref:GntR family transcriptional regulator n=1 Tax=Citreicella sp. C3M06 TaxID=2841564 RepID=UPI001C09DF40|nr:GntR family transcriptional regulator [Citreicella sp. C3M06]MBU2963534.1 GntR family transcriptional regulator [Citreicella sp. C3M06]
MARKPTDPGAARGAEHVYRMLRRAILRMELTPGSDLDELEISARYEVSRTPVREALIRLGSEGLVQVVRGRGARVAAMNLFDLRDFFEALDLLQRAQTHLAALRRSDAQLAAIEAAQDAFEAAATARDVEEINETNCAFHLAISAAAGSSHLHDSYERALIEGMRVGHVSFVEHAGHETRLREHLAQTNCHHRELIAHIRARDAAAAERVAAAHVDLFRDRIVATVLTPDITRAIRTDK